MPMHQDFHGFTCSGWKHWQVQVLLDGSFICTTDLLMAVDNPDHNIYQIF